MMIMLKKCCASLIVGAVAILGLVTFSDAAIPSYIKVCSRKDPDINNCIIDSINHLRPHLAKGIPELNVPPIEPFEVDTLHLHLDDSGRTLNLTNIQVWGVINFKITDLKSRIGKSKVHFRYKAEVPDLKVTGKYEIDSKLLFIELKGKGDLSMNISKYSFECAMTGNKVRSGASSHIIFEPIVCELQLEGVRIRLENLFNGNEAAERATNEAINDNINLFVDDLKPTLLSSLALKFTDISNRITRTFEYSELFPV